MLKFAFFVFTTLLVICGAHALIAFTLLRFSGITDPVVRRVIFWITGFLALSFLPSAVLLRFHSNIFTQFFYIFSAAWLGLFIHFLTALVLIWVIFGLGKAAGLMPDMRLITIGCFMAAAVFSAYGVWRARNPVLKPVQIAVRGLPAPWENRTIVQLSDVHLGAINGTGFLKKVVDKVNHAGPDIIFITGDLFDGMGDDLDSFVRPLKGLKAPLGTFFVTGNHEGYLGLAGPLRVLRQAGIRILDNEIIDVDGLQIIGIPFPEHRLKKRNPGRLFESASYDPGRPSVLLYHTPTDIGERNADRGSQQARTYWFPDTGFELAKQVGIDLQLSGHTHRGQIFPFGFLTRMIYNGYDHGLHRDGDFQIYISSGTGTWGPPMRTHGASEITVITLKN